MTNKFVNFGLKKIEIWHFCTIKMLKIDIFIVAQIIKNNKNGKFGQNNLQILVLKRIKFDIFTQ